MTRWRFQYVLVANTHICSDNRPLPINRKQKVFPNGTLIIENVERNSDQATYTCVAKNQEGYSARGSLEVQVMGKLSILITAPTSLKEVARQPIFLGGLNFQHRETLQRWSLFSLKINYPSNLSAATDSAL